MMLQRRVGRRLPRKATKSDPFRPLFEAQLLRPLFLRRRQEATLIASQHACAFVLHVFGLQKDLARRFRLALAKR